MWIFPDSSDPSEQGSDGAKFKPPGNHGEHAKKGKKLGLKR
jgi:hypothetical protein